MPFCDKVIVLSKNNFKIRRNRILVISWITRILGREAMTLRAQVGPSELWLFGGFKFYLISRATHELLLGEKGVV